MARAPQGSVLEPTLYLIFINDLPNEVLSRIGISADDTSLYSSLGKSVFFEKVESAGELELDLHSIVEWGGRRLVTFNSHRDPLLVPVEINGIELPEEASFRLLCLTFTRSLDGKPYTQSIANVASRKVGSSVSLLLLNPSCICTNIPFGLLWSTVPIFGA